MDRAKRAVPPATVERNAKKPAASTTRRTRRRKEMTKGWTSRASCQTCWVSSAVGSLSPTCRASALCTCTGARAPFLCTRPMPLPCFSAPPSLPPAQSAATTPTCTRRSSSPPLPCPKAAGSSRRSPMGGSCSTHRVGPSCSPTCWTGSCTAGWRMCS
uniref:Predicted protein n=1 Tax=Hordeum vulgare subsp. vulgare TaxID=112509 RepID=F2DT68_HORVV|nr:predicted protein [Hordeum vulgare subsp. vulgare]